MRNSYFLWIVLFCSTVGIAQKKEHVLMVGNSFTFYYNLPITIEQLAKSKGLNWEVHQSTASGATLKQHWKGEKGLQTTKKIKRKRYQHIIVQEHSTYPITALDSTQKYLNKIIDLSSKGAQKYLFATWQYPKMKTNIAPLRSSLPIEEALISIKPTKEISILPVGRAFDLFQKRFPSQTLFTSDQKHPNPIGSYLAACVIFSKVSGLSSKGFARRISRKSQNQKEIFYFIVEKQVALQCQAIADEIIFGDL